LKKEKGRYKMENKKLNKFITKITKEIEKNKKEYLTQGAEYVYENASEISQMKQIEWYLTDHFYDRFENENDFIDSRFDKLQKIKNLCKSIYAYYKNLNNFENKYDLSNFEDLDFVMEYFKEDTITGGTK